MTNGWSPNNTSKIILKKFKNIKTAFRNEGGFLLKKTKKVIKKFCELK